MAIRRPGEYPCVVRYPRPGGLYVRVPMHAIRSMSRVHGILTPLSLALLFSLFLGEVRGWGLSLGSIFA